jgi:hypothetical protein
LLFIDIIGNLKSNYKRGMTTNKTKSKVKCITFSCVYKISKSLIPG